MLAVAGPSPLWYLTRGTGAVALLLLTASVVLGVLNSGNRTFQAWPRFTTSGVHRNVSLLVLVLLAIHILTAEMDTFAPVGWPAVLVPFTSSYRAIWLGFGTLAFDLLLAISITSIARPRIGYRTWRLVHWGAYFTWPLALVHSFGTGTDARLSWMKMVAFVCGVAVVAAAAWRLADGWPSRAGVRVTSGAAATVGLIAIAAWSLQGPLRAGWARRAGTPPSLLGARAPAAGASGAPSGGGAATGGVAAPSGGIGILPLSTFVTGSLTETGPDQSGLVTVTLRLSSSGASADVAEVVLRGVSSGGGVSMQSSAVSFGPSSAPSQYQGTVTALEGSQIAAAVTSASGGPLSLGLDLQIDSTSGSVQGTLNVQAARAERRH